MLRDAGVTRALPTEDQVRRLYPEYACTSVLDDLRASDYASLERCGCTYLDYTGGGLFAASQVRRHNEYLTTHVLGNPHSHNPASLAAGHAVEEARRAVRDFFNAPCHEFDVVFTANATGALKLIGEAYPFGPGGRYLLSYDNHNSVNGIREFAHRKGAAVEYIPVRRRDLRLDEEALGAGLERQDEPGVPRLFAFPAQSNFSGVQHPLDWVARAQRLGWDVLLDCAAYAPTNPLDLQAVGPDFAVVSFYKLFGYPTGIGALIARRAALAKLRRPWFAGGTVAFASVQADEGFRLSPGPWGFEDGTIDYLGLPAVTIGLRHLTAIGMDTIHTRVATLTAVLLDELQALTHRDGAPLVRVFGPAGTDGRGGIVALQVLDPQGRPYDVDEVELEAGQAAICVRTGCFCNPGDGEVAHDISREDMELCFRDPRRLTTLRDCQRVISDATGKVPNTVRVSLGLVSNVADVARLVAFLDGYRDRPCGTPLPGHPANEAVHVE